MNLLRRKLIDRIRSDGPITFETFMDMCLYYPGLGYYTKDSTDIGRSGDFYTSPHLHPIFGAMIARQLEEMWHHLGEPDVFHVVEMGAGTGYLAKDILEYIHRFRSDVPHPGFAERLSYTIVELNPSVRQRQERLLTEFGERIRWISDLGELEAVRGCLLSNELLDAFPVRVVEMGDELMEIYVSISSVSQDDDQLIEVKRPCGNDVREYFNEYGITLPAGYRTEVNLRLKGWIAEAGAKIAEGFVMTVDYGYPAWDYYSEDRRRGTLLCYHRHQVNEDPYQYIGEQDLTAHVNFSSLKRWGEEHGFRTLGFCPQGTYLVSLGIDEVMAELYPGSPDAFETARIKGLILPQGMGESHRVMIQYKGAGSPKLRGFAMRNQESAL